MRQNKYEYDAFISHAVEDKIPIANELCAKLERAGLRVWYSGKELGIGDSIEKTIARGLNRSRYGIVVFSPTYLAKNWTIREFYTLLAKEIEEQKVILPVLYNITLDELKNKDLVMADRFAVNADRGIDHVVDRLVAEIKRPARQPKKRELWFSKVWMVLILSLLVNVALLLKGSVFVPSGGVQAVSMGEAAALSPNYDYPATLLGEIQGLLTAMSGCHYDHPRGEPSRYRHTFASMGPSGDYPADVHVTSLPRTETATGNRNKVTMAIVFQIENQAPAPATAPDEEQIFQAVSLQDDDEEIRLQTAPGTVGSVFASGNHDRSTGFRDEGHDRSERKTRHSESF